MKKKISMLFIVIVTLTIFILTCYESKKIDMSNPINTIIVEKVAEELGIDKNEVTKENLKEITYLNLSDRDLTDKDFEIAEEYNLDILGYMTNLEELHISGIECENYLFLSKLINLKTIWLYSSGNNKLIAFNQLNILTSMKLDGFNNIDTESIKSLVNLNYLALANCAFKNTDFISNIKGLKTLILSNFNDIKFLSSMENLETLYINGNKIDDITPIMNLKNLKTLVLSNTNVENIIPISSFINLERLDLSNTNVRDISCIEKLTNLSCINLENIKVDNIESLQYMNKLYNIRLRNTNVSDVSPLAKANKEQLVDLDIRGTKVTSLKPFIDYEFNIIIYIDDFDKIIDIKLLEDNENIFITTRPYIGG